MPSQPTRRALQPPQLPKPSTLARACPEGAWALRRPSPRAKATPPRLPVRPPPLAPRARLGGAGGRTDGARLRLQLHSSQGRPPHSRMCSSQGRNGQPWHAVRLQPRHPPHLRRHPSHRSRSPRAADPHDGHIWWACLVGPPDPSVEGGALHRPHVHRFGKTTVRPRGRQLAVDPSHPKGTLRWGRPFVGPDCSTRHSAQGRAVVWRRGGGHASAHQRGK
eukprot:scaffold28014_cov106-Isochrysis_galbana.AAC.4